MSEVSRSAISRVLALRAQELSAAKALAEGDGYSDFFVEGGGGSWHEAFEDVITGEREFSAERMAFVDRVRMITGADDYSDFFVENGGSWHEAFEDVITGDRSFFSDPGLRAQALSSLRVVDAYANLRLASRGE
jgi:hypothetical protein